MTPEEHKARHVELHEALDELVANWMLHTKYLPSQDSVMTLMKWSHAQTEAPSEEQL